MKCFICVSFLTGRLPEMIPKAAQINILSLLSDRMTPPTVLATVVVLFGRFSKRNVTSNCDVAWYVIIDRGGLWRELKFHSQVQKIHSSNLLKRNVYVRK